MLLKRALYWLTATSCVLLPLQTIQAQSKQTFFSLLCGLHNSIPKSATPAKDQTPLLEGPAVLILPPYHPFEESIFQSGSFNTASISVSGFGSFNTSSAGSLVISPSQNLSTCSGAYIHSSSGSGSFSVGSLVISPSQNFPTYGTGTVIPQTQSGSFAIKSISDSQKLHNNFEGFFDEMQQQYPELATYVGSTKAYNGLWTDHSETGYLLRCQLVWNRLESLSWINRENLSSADKLNYDLFKKDLEESVEGFQFQTYYMPLDQLGGIPLDVSSTLMMMPRESVEDYETILMRLSGIPVLIDQTIDLLKKGVEKGLTQPKIVLRTLSGNLAKMTPSSADKSVFFQPFMSFPEDVGQDQQDQICQSALESIEKGVYPAYAKLLDYLENEYIPACRETIATGDLPNGKDLYNFSIKKHTTTNLTPKEIHEIGLAEVARIQSEMQQILDDTQFSGSIADYLEYLNTSPEFFYTEPENLIEGYKAITSYIDGQLPLLFGRLPKLPYEVVPVPSFSEEGQVGAYYMRGSLATGRPGRFYANTYDIGSRPKWEMESLSLHEAVPGHHFQISIAQEIDGLPEFRKYNGYTAYIEGWGLYSESLGKELGLYKAPSDQFGRLVAEIWRSVRLVVDTGMHALGWTREEAMAYMMEKAGMGEREATTEIDRYIVWPGQALAYKIGELSIQKWRQEAQQALGSAFDIRAFHDMLLEQGALPLDICEKYVHNWIEAQK